MFIYAVYSSAAENSDIDASPVSLYVASRDPGNTTGNDQLYYRHMLEFNKSKHVYPGCFIDPQSYQVVRRPQYILHKEEPVKNNVVPVGGDAFKSVDGTTVNLYSIDGDIWRLATYNSWDISTIKEYGITYIDYFKESLRNCGIDLDLSELNHEMMYTFTFSNPKLHLMADRCAVYYWGGGLEEYNWNKPTPLNPGDVEDGFIVLYADSIYVHVSETFREVSDILYSNRSNQYRKGDDYKKSIYRHALYILFTRNVDMVKVRKYINREFTFVLNNADNFSRKLETEKGAKYNGVDIPARIVNEVSTKNISRQVRDYKTINPLLHMFRNEMELTDDNISSESIFDITH
jgi:hypothetical protein